MRSLRVFLVAGFLGCIVLVFVVQSKSIHFTLGECEFGLFSPGIAFARPRFQIDFAGVGYSPELKNFFLPIVDIGRYTVVTLPWSWLLAGWGGVIFLMRPRQVPKLQAFPVEVKS